jgi:hypothetical protein
VTPTQADIARKLVALPGWEWRAGMRAIGKWTEYPVRVIGYGERPFDDEDAHAADPFLWWQEPRGDDGGPYLGPYVPDLSDLGTAGVLLGMLPPVPWWTSQADGVYTIDVYMEATGDQHPGDPRNNVSGHGATLGEAVAAALIAVGRVR